MRDSAIALPASMKGGQQPSTEESRTFQGCRAVQTAFTNRWKDQVRRARGPVRIVDLPDASHFVFFSTEADVLGDIRAFFKAPSPSSSSRR